jgi:hypothetical protein
LGGSQFEASLGKKFPRPIKKLGLWNSVIPTTPEAIDRKMEA